MDVDSVKLYFKVKYVISFHVSVYYCDARIAIRICQIIKVSFCSTIFLVKRELVKGISVKITENNPNFLCQRDRAIWTFSTVFPLFMCSNGRRILSLSLCSSCGTRNT